MNFRIKPILGVFLGIAINLLLMNKISTVSGLYFGTFGMSIGGYDMTGETWYDRVIKVLEEREYRNVLHDPKNMKPSTVCIEMIQFFEGFRSEAYRDSVGVWTIGYGTTRGVKPGDTITRKEAEERMLDELDRDYSPVVRTRVTVPLTQSMFDALSCFVYNTGGTQFARSTMLRKLNSGDYEGAAEEFDRWVYADGKKLNGLVNRRRAEKELFLMEDWG